MAHKTPTTGDYRKFGLFLAALFAGAGLIPLLRGAQVLWWPEAVGAAIAAVALSAPAAIRPVYRVSLKVGGVLGWVNTRILLGAMFFLVFTPTGLIVRLVRGKVASWNNRARQPSYWHPREKVNQPEQMRHLF